MSIEWLRDLVIVIFGITAIVATIVLVVLALMLYSRLKPILDSVKKTTATVSRIVSDIEDVVSKPIARIKSFLQGLTGALGFMKRFTGREGD
jgi:hypothetical protein